MREMPLVSIIISAYNAEKYIDECIKSLFSQTYKNIEIIVCDDCSSDRTLAKLRKYTNNNHFILLHNERNIHQARSRNKCIEIAKGSYIMIQDADDISEPVRIEKLLNQFEDNISFVGSGSYLFDEKGIFGKLYGRRTYPKPQDLLWGMPFVHASLMFKREALKAVGGYSINKYTERGEDYDLIMRMYSCGMRGKNTKDLLYGYRVNQETYARRNLKSRLDECVIRYQGYKANNLLFPLGWIFILKPVPAYIYQLVTTMKRKGYENK